MAAGDVRDRILDAVNRVIVRNCLNSTTIDAIAAEAGVSKGGVLHYFSSKKEILFAMLDRYEEQFYARRAEILKDLPDKPGSTLKATVLTMLENLDMTEDEVPNIVSVLGDDELRDKVAEFKKKLFAESGGATDRCVKVGMVAYIVDGLWMDNIFKPTVIPEECRQRLREELLKLVDSIG